MLENLFDGCDQAVQVVRVGNADDVESERAGGLRRVRADPRLPARRQLVEEAARPAAYEPPDTRLPDDDVRDQPGDALRVQGTST